MQGSIAYFGTSSVNETDKTIITTHIEGCTFPNWIGTDRKVSFTLSGDELSTTGISASSMGTGIVRLVWKRSK